MAVLTDAEIEELRWHLGWGNISVGGYPHTPDGYFEAIRNVVAEYLTTEDETSATTAITANSTTTVEPVSMTGIAANVRLLVDVGDEAEVVVVKAVTDTAFVAKFAIAHAASGYPVAVYSGLARLRYLLHQANKAFTTLTGNTITKSAGLKSVGRGAVEWYGNGAQFQAIQQHYRGIVNQLSALVRVPVNDELWGGPLHQMEAY
ncbi:hypothetical protein WMF38_57500 [Sorangium sp. So ce118]